MSCFSMQPEGQVSLIVRFLEKTTNIKEHCYVLMPKLLEKCFIMQKRSLRLDYEVTESWPFSITKLIWGIFIFV